jgi:uncharacterized alkaline shock family protein YloU
MHENVQFFDMTKESQQAVADNVREAAANASGEHGALLLTAANLVEALVGATSLQIGVDEEEEEPITVAMNIITSLLEGISDHSNEVQVAALHTLSSLADTLMRQQGGR